jgi:hypothetical protein
MPQDIIWTRYYMSVVVAYSQRSITFAILYHSSMMPQDIILWTIEATILYVCSSSLYICIIDIMRTVGTWYSSTCTSIHPCNNIITIMIYYTDNGTCTTSSTPTTSNPDRDDIL